VFFFFFFRLKRHVFSFVYNEKKRAAKTRKVKRRRSSWEKVLK